MRVVRTASLSEIDSASNVFESDGAGMYTLIKSRQLYGMHVGKSYDRTTVVGFATLHTGTLIIEGGNAMSNAIESSVNQRTITLVTIPQEVADAVEWSRKKDGEIDGIIDRVKSMAFGGHNTDALRSIPFETLLSALVNGFVVEKSAEELETQRTHDAIRAEYMKANARYLTSQYLSGIADGIEFTLDMLGVSIEGVNA